MRPTIQRVGAMKVREPGERKGQKRNKRNKDETKNKGARKSNGN
jgi:hypothetical protein